MRALPQKKQQFFIDVVAHESFIPFGKNPEVLTFDSIWFLFYATLFISKRFTQFLCVFLSFPKFLNSLLLDFPKKLGGTQANGG